MTERQSRPRIAGRSESRGDLNQQAIYENREQMNIQLAQVRIIAIILNTGTRRKTSELIKFLKYARKENSKLGATRKLQCDK